MPTDGLFDRYSNRDFRRVHEACIKWGERLAAMFAAVPEPFVAARRKHQTKDDMMEKRRRVVELRDQAKTLAQMSEEMKLSIGAVRMRVDPGSKKKVERRRSSAARRQSPCWMRSLAVRATMKPNR